MPQAKAAHMVSAHTVTVSTTAGHTIRFEPGEEIYVPALAVSECLKAGARPVRQYTNTATNVPGATAAGRITSEVTIPEEELEAVEEAILNADTDTQNRTEREEPKRNERVFTEAETRIKNAIEDMMDESSPDEWTNGLPKVTALISRVRGMSVTAVQRDRVWERMLEAGLIPEDYAEVLGL